MGKSNILKLLFIISYIVNNYNTHVLWDKDIISPILQKKNWSSEKGSKLLNDTHLLRGPSWLTWPQICLISQAEVGLNTQYCQKRTQKLLRKVWSIEVARDVFNGQVKF